MCCGNSLFAQSGPEIEVLTPVVCIPGKVTVQLKGCATCVSWDWEIGTGTGYKSGNANYSVVMTKAGIYDVNVKLKTAAGVTTVISKQKAFEVKPSPVIRITANKRVFCGYNDTVLLIDSTPNIVSRDWLIESNIIYNGPKTIAHQFSNSYGWKKIFLLVRDSWGCASQTTRDSVVGIWNKPSITVATSKTSGCLPGNVRYIPSFDTGVQTIKSVSWTFTGGSPPVYNGRFPKPVAYSTSDTFGTKVTFFTHQGCSATFDNPKMVVLGDSVALNVTVSPKTICANKPFTAKVTNSLNKAPGWNFTGPAVLLDSSTGVNISGRFKDTGLADVEVFEVNRGCISYKMLKGAIRVNGPVASFETLVQSYCASPDTLKFKNTSIPGPGTTWKWEIMDTTGAVQGSGTTKDFEYRVTKVASWSTRLIAVSTNGCTDTVFMKKNVTGGKIDANFTVAPNPACPNQEIFLTSATGKGSAQFPNTLVWTFYGATGKPVYSVASNAPFYKYANTGKYSAKLVISNTKGCKDSLFLKDTIKVEIPAAKLSVSDSIVCTNQGIRFYGSRSSKLKGMKALWIFKNIDSTSVPDQSSFGDTTDYSFAAPGRYEVYYSLSDNLSGGCSVTIKLPQRIKVSTVRYKVTPGPDIGCKPLTFNLSATQLTNVNHKTGSNTVWFRWKNYHPANLTIADSSKANTTAVLKQSYAQYSLVWQNDAGCKDSSPWYLTSVALESGFDLPGNERCIKKPIKMHNASVSWATGFKWICDSSTAIFSSKTAREPTVIFTKGGFYTIKLIAYYNACADTFTRVVKLESVIADFYAPDSVVYCAPKLMNFVNRTLGANRNWWTFGDGDSVYSVYNNKVGHLYKKNKTRPGYDVTLITENSFGCRDTLTKKGYARVVGPLPGLAMSNFIGCEPLQVKFTNTSTDYNKFYLDFADGSVLDSTKVMDHFYKVTDKSLPVQAFHPRLLLYDSFGCFAIASPDDSVMVSKNAEAFYTYTSTQFLRKTEGCAGDLYVSFRNRSFYTVKTYWDFDGDGVIDIKNQNNPGYLYLTPGLFYPRLIAENINGCRDTISRDSIRVWEPPDAAFATSADTTCARDTVRFWYNGKPAHAIDKYDWDFGENGIYYDTSTQPLCKWKYTAPFNHLADLEVTDIKGCKGRTQRNVFVNDTAGPERNPIAFITVKNNNAIDFVWNKSVLGNYYSYHVFLDSIGLKERGVKYARTDTSWSAYYGAVMGNKRICYTIKVEDTCSQIGKPSSSHCTIVLRDTIKEPFHFHLSWLAYDWWSNELSHYEVFRQDPGGSFKRVAIVDRDNISYVDSFLCDAVYCYYVEAVHKNGLYRSRSNTVCDKILYLKPDGVSPIELVTVANDDHTEMRWKPYYRYIRGGSWILEKCADPVAGFTYLKEVSGESASDLAADVHKNAWYYRVRFKDHCGVTGNAGPWSNSLFLQGIPGTGLLTIDWNDYRHWQSGVKEYHLQLRQKNGQFGTWKVYNAGTTQQYNVDLESFGLDSIFFRVLAVKDSITYDTSVSNVAVFIPRSYVWVPSAFTPDGNNRNETFKPIAGFVYGYQDNPNNSYGFRVLNRWGEQVFYTNQPGEGWDGNYKGISCPAGMYIWEFRAVGFDGIIHRKKGTVMLLR
ncbi:MAG: gliding motility-associated C-terminal domain-containing protein [Bacteroidetes bacterium]|nr:gliding motility-associated C-terminal domain-containing protein [Bacteroidota bacterium]